jgi:Ca2+-binding RTX toxin-like protein
MATFIGTSADDVLEGTGGADTFEIAQGGDDRISSGKGDDTFVIGSAFTAADRIDGGTGNDTLVLDGDYALSLVATSMTSIERIELSDGHDYALTLHDNNVPRNATLTVSAAALTTGALDLDAAAVAKGAITILGGALDDSLHGCGGVNTFDGGAGDDFLFAPVESSGSFDGGQGDDTVIVNGHYELAGGEGFDFLVIPDFFDQTVLAPAEWGFEVLQLSGQLTGTDGDDVWDFSGVIISGEPQVIGMDGDDVMIGAADHFNRFFGLAGNDRLVGGSETDEMSGGSGNNKLFGAGGDDILGNFEVLSDGPGRTLLDGGNGNDMLFAVDGLYRVSGGDGNDRIGLEHTTVRQNTIAGGDGIDTLVLEFDGATFDVDLFDAATTGIENLEVFGDAIGSARANTLDFSGFTVVGTKGVTIDGKGDNDALIGTGLGDTLMGGEGEDTLSAGAGADVFAYAAVTDSIGSARDRITDFNLAEGDMIDLWIRVDAVRAPVVIGAASAATFDVNLTLAVNPLTLGAHEALIFTPNLGSLAGLNFLVVDVNGIAGYQAAQDLVVEIAGGDLTGLDLGDFT